MHSHRSSQFFLKLFILPIFIFLTACTSLHSNNRWGYSNSHTHIVQPGETLAGIARSYGMSSTTLASYNRFSPSYHVQAGQKIYLGPYQQTRTKSYEFNKADNQEIVIETMPRETIQERILSGFSQSNRFQWPASGRLIRKYSLQNGSKGIDLKGLKGDPIYASSNGVVVFSGSALRGYGNLIIIKHDETFLTAYGHVGRLFVRERENVKVGRKIAEMGNDVSQEVLLHFEIRKRGMPVDPLAYLSKTQIKI